MSDFFINPWMLGGLALVSAPIIIHLLNKRRFQIVDWAAIDFLFQAESRNRRRIRIEDLILLLLRILLIALIVLALSRPVFQNYIGNREDERTVVLDDSFSMEASGGTGIPFVAARAAASRQVEEAVGHGMAFNVWLGSRARQIAALSPEDTPEASGAAVSGGGSSTESSHAGRGASFAARSGEVLRSLREVEMSDAPLSLGLVLERLRERFASVDRPLMRSVVLLSDFRRSDWMLEEGGSSGGLFEGGGELRPEIVAGVAALEKEGLLERVQLRFVDLGNEGRENLAIVDLRVVTDLPTAGAPVKLALEVQNLGEQERRAVRGWVEVGTSIREDSGQTSAPGATARSSPMALPRVKFPEIVSIPAGETVTAIVECTVAEPGEYPLTAVLEGTGDRLQRDDRAHAVLEVRRGLRLLLVDGDPGSERFDGEAGFLTAALAPRGPISSDIVIDHARGSITDRAVAGADVIFVLNRADFSAGEVALLHRFVRSGGGLGFFLGNRVRPERYATLFPPPEASAEDGALSAAELSLFPVTLGDAERAVTSSGRAHLRIADERHRAFRVFRGVEGSSIEQVGFDRFFEMKPRAGARVVATFDDEAKTPAIVDAGFAVASGAAAASPDETSASKKSAAGKVVVFNMTADRDWNDWPTDPSYPIVFQEWARYLAPRLGEERKVTAGRILSWERAPGVRYDVLLPNGELRPVDETKDTEGTMAFFRDTYRAGFYRVIPSVAVAGAQIAPGALQPFLFACVRDPRESRLAAADATRLTAALAALGVDVVLGRSERGRVVTRDEGGEIWRWLAMGAGIFLVVELLAAWWMGRR